MRKKRSIRFRKKRLKRQVMDLDITSLLDILVIILVFLLKSYNTAGVIFNVPKGIVLPKSESKTNNTPGVVVQVSEDRIWVDDELILDYKDTKGQRVSDHGGRLIVPLFNKLSEKRRTIELIAKKTPEANKFSGVVNLIVDKKVKYNQIKKLMYTSAEARYQKYKFVVLGEEQ